MTYEIGVNTSALSTEDPFQAAKRVRGLGLGVYQLSSLDGFVREAGGKRRASDQLSDLTQNGPTIHSLYISRPRIWKEWVGHSKRYIEIAANIGVDLVTEHIRPIGPDDGKVTRGNLKKIVEYGMSRGVEYAIDTGNEGIIEMLALASQVENLGFCFDPGNFLYNGLTMDDVLFYLRWIGKISQIHVKDAREGEFTALGEGNLDLGAFIDGLVKVGYEGPLIIEDSREDVEQRHRDMGKAIQTLRSALESMVEIPS